MHYLKDYLELLEPLRDIMREKFTLMRESDLKLQAEFAQLEEDSSEFLNNYRVYQKQSSLSPTKSKIQTDRSIILTNDQSLEMTPEQLAAQQQKQTEYNKLIERHEELLKMNTVKISLANDSHEFVERYFKKLENDLHKFKMELEADYSGLTEVLEKRTLKSLSFTIEKYRFILGFANEDCNDYENKMGENGILDPSLIDIEPLFDSFDDLTMPKSLTHDLPLNCVTSQAHRLSTGPNSCHPLSLLNRKSHQRLYSNSLSSSSSRGRKRLQSASSTNNSEKRKRNTLNDSHDFHQSDTEESLSNHFFNLKHTPYDSETYVDLDPLNVLSNLNEQTTENIDERRYCICNQISYGDMIACDNPTCRREWFHYPCVGIITPPKGKWFCTECTQILQQQNMHK
ncbi:unnamed protein product [Adineta steineri]|uniref:Inhibitor of growth protein n=1 Tax=Adineta steineri TaxID=433720 RepID=A0A814P6S3_9BILA|nr:unnamed protein product [Adineta steineri]